MRNIVKVAAVGFLSFNFISGVSAASIEAMRSLGLGGEALTVPAVPAPAAAFPGTSIAPDFFGCLGRGENLRAAAISRAKGMKGTETGPVASIELESIKNAYLKSDVSFTTGAGTKVHLTSYVASNCPDGGTSCATKEKIFLVLTTDRNENYFVRAIEIVNWGIFMHGSKTVAIDGEKYALKAYANVSAPDNSKIEIKGPRGVALSSSLKQVADAQARKGTEVNLSKTYKLLYGNEILQGPQGVRFGPAMQVLLIEFPVTDKSDTKILRASELTPSGISFPSFESGYSFGLENGILGISKL